MGETYERRNMAGSVFRDVNLAGATFDNVNLSGVTISNSNLSGLCIKDTRIAGAGMTVLGFRIDELIEAELDRRDPVRASLRMQDIYDPESVRKVITRLDRLRSKFFKMLRSKDARLLAARPEPGEWSAIEVVRHLVFAEDLYLNHLILRNDKPWLKLGLLPDFYAKDPRYAGVGSEPAGDIDMVLAAWKSVHAGTREFVARVTSEELHADLGFDRKGTVGSILQFLAHHDLNHIYQAEAALAAAVRAG